MIKGFAALRYRELRRKGMSARDALSCVRDIDREPAYAFLSDLGPDHTVSGTVDGFTVTVAVCPDEHSVLGEDDITGTFTDVYMTGCVPNTTTGGHGDGSRFYRPSTYTLEHGYDDFRRMGMARDRARQALRERIDAEMFADSERTWFGVIVTASMAGHDLACDSLWGIDSTPEFDVSPHLIEVAEELLPGVIDSARAALPRVLASVLGDAAALCAALGTEH